MLQAVRHNNLNVGGGNITENGNMLLVHGVARPTTVQQLQGIVVAARDGVPIRVRDVAEVVIGHEIRRGAVTADGQGEVTLGLGFMLMGENSYKVTNRLKDKLDQVKSSLPPGTEVVVVYDRTELVDQVIETVKNNLFEGGLLVVAILFVFLGNLRAGLIVALAIPLSLLFAFSGMLRFGIAASLLSLGALDFGLVVDSSVVMIENVVHTLSRARPAGAERTKAVGDACAEVAKPSVMGVFIIMIVYLPILALEGVEGKLFRPMALTVIFALFGSMLMSLTLIPVLATLGLPRQTNDHEPWPVRLALKAYLPLLRLALRRPRMVFAAAVAALAVAGVLASRLGSEFLPRLNEGALVVGVMRMPGTSLEESVQLNTRMERVIRERFPDEIKHVWSRAGAPEVATDASTVEMVDFFITLTPRERWTKARTQAELVSLIEGELKDIPGQFIWFSQPIEQRINEMISGSRADLAVKLYGPDFDVLLPRARETEAVLRDIPGSADLTVEQVLGQPVLQVRVRPDDIARYGVSAQTVLDLIESVGGKPVGDLTESQLRFPLVIRLPDSYRGSPDAVASLLVPTASGERLPLERLADVQLVEGARVISREWGQRRVTIQCNVRGRDIGGFVREAQSKVRPLAESLPPGGYRIEWGGQFENLERANARLALVVPLALVLILVMLYFTLNNLRDALLVFSSVPFACVGGVAALAWRDMPFSISAAVGFIALSGISILNSLVLVEFIRQLRGQGVPLTEAVQEAGKSRLRPVLMTALVASLGFVPMALSEGMGAEVQRPLATVVIGGVVSCTLMTLLVLPVLYNVFGARRGGTPVAGAGGVPH